MAAQFRNALQIGFLVVVILTSIAIAFHAFGFQLRISGAESFHLRFDETPVFSAMHVLGGGLCLLLGGFQFSRRLRTKRPRLHRNFGRTYLILVAIGGIGSLVLAPNADGGLVARFGFGLLAVLWLSSGLQAYRAIRQRDIQSHRAWMLRNFALTFAAVTLRIQLGLFELGGVPFEAAYPTVAWLSWVPNLVVIEWYLALSTAHRAPRDGLAEKI